MAQSEPPKIEYPCRYPIKVMGPNADDFPALVHEIGERHADPIPLSDVRVRESRNGRWVAVTLTIVARSEAQIEAIFTDLKATGRVTLTL